MIGLDTNLLLRYLLDDDETQARQARDFIHGAVSRGESLFINLIVLCEFVWVLGRSYQRTEEEIAAALEQIMTVEEFDIQERSLVVGAIQDFRSRRVDFADCLIGVLNRSVGCASTITFDRSAGGLDSFSLLKGTRRNK
jgi:predicted nucleic-acid-binding protein